MVLCHRDSYAICLKATSKLDLYDNNPIKNKGCVRLAVGYIDCFPLTTIVDPDFHFPIHHSVIWKAQENGTFEVHKMPMGFEDRLRKAIANSGTLGPIKRARILSMISD